MSAFVAVLSLVCFVRAIAVFTDLMVTIRDDRPDYGNSGDTVERAVALFCLMLLNLAFAFWGVCLLLGVL